MNTIAMQKVTFAHRLSLVPQARLNAALAYLEALLMDTPKPARQNRSLKGIWKDAGFEKILNLEETIGNVRRELQDSILQREF